MICSKSLEKNIDLIKNLHLQVRFFFPEKKNYFQVLSIMLLQQNDLFLKQFKNKTKPWQGWGWGGGWRERGRLLTPPQGGGGRQNNGP